MFCAGCGVLNSMARSRCRECGKPLHEPAPGAAPVPVPEVFGMPLGEDEVVCRGCHRISPAADEWCAGCERRLRLPAPVASPPSSAGRTRVCPRCRRINGEGASFCWDCGAALVREAGPYVPAPRPPAVDRAVSGLRCPACGTAMDAGDAGLGMNFRRFATWMAGSGWLELFFRRAGEEEKEWVMRPNRPAAAARCPGCGGVWLSPPRT